MRLDRAWIEAHVPHQGAMCLLDEVLEWDAHHIVCGSATHRDPGNPLRAHGRLAAVCGIEYAAQAMAVHGALLAPPSNAANPQGPPRAGYLTSLRGVQCFCERLDEYGHALHAAAERISGDERSILYRFGVSHEGQMLLEGRATVILDTSLWAGAKASGT